MANVGDTVIADGIVYVVAWTPQWNAKSLLPDGRGCTMDYALAGRIKKYRERPNSRTVSPSILDQAKRDLARMSR